MSAVRRRDLREGALARRSAERGGRFIGAFGWEWCCEGEGQTGGHRWNGQGWGADEPGGGRCEPSNGQMGCSTLTRFG